MVVPRHLLLRLGSFKRPHGDGSPTKPRRHSGAAGGARLPARHAFTVVELLLVIAVIAVLAGIALPAMSGARGRARGIKCAANLRSVAQAVLSYAAAFDDVTYPATASRDYFWNRGEQVGWDIVPGRWSHLEGGPGTPWCCTAQDVGYHANVKALGLDMRATSSGGSRVYWVGPRQWLEPSKLALCYDVQPNLMDNLYPGGVDSLSADLSDEFKTNWTVDSERPVIWLDLRAFGPHRGGAFGTAFGDGHSECGTFELNEQYLFWSGQRWWPDRWDEQDSPDS